MLRPNSSSTGRGEDVSVAQRRTTSVIDTVATRDLIRRGGQTLVPVAGIATLERAASPRKGATGIDTKTASVLPG